MVITNEFPSDKAIFEAVVSAWKKLRVRMMRKNSVLRVREIGGNQDSSKIF